MTAYKQQELDNAVIQEEALAACKKECITKAEYQHVRELYPTRIYTPNPFIRLGLFLLTAVVVVFSLGLLGLLFMETLRGEETLGVLLFFFGLACYGALELFVKEKQHLRSGVDDALAWAAAGLILGSFSFMFNIYPNTGAYFLIVMLLGVFFAIRFLNMLMGLAAFAGLVGVVFFSMIFQAVGLLPFALMVVCGAVFVGARTIKASPHHAATLHLVEVAALVMLYLAGNYYVVHETGNSFYGGEDKNFYTGWLFWVFTIIIPPIYIYAGIRKKDKILLRTGLVLIALVVFTIRYYYSVMPMESAMVLSGSIMIIVAYLLTRYLKVPRNGFTGEAMDGAETLKGLQIAESLIIAQTFKEAPQQGDQFEFGGGSSRGGGAGGDY